MEGMTATQAVQAVSERYEKLNGIAYGDVEQAFASLRLLFTQRKLIADLLLRETNHSSVHEWEMLEWAENKIKRALFL